MPLLSGLRTLAQKRIKHAQKEVYNKTPSRLAQDWGLGTGRLSKSKRLSKRILRTKDCLELDYSLGTGDGTGAHWHYNTGPGAGVHATLRAAGAESILRWRTPARSQTRPAVRATATARSNRQYRAARARARPLLNCHRRPRMGRRAGWCKQGAQRECTCMRA